MTLDQIKQEAESFFPADATLSLSGAISFAKHCVYKATWWRPIEEAPKDGTEVIVMYMHIDTQIVHNAFWISKEDGEDEGWWSYDKSEVSRVLLNEWMTPTHYLPLPPEAA